MQLSKLSFGSRSPQSMCKLLLVFLPCPRYLCAQPAGSPTREPSSTRWPGSLDFTRLSIFSSRHRGKNHFPSLPPPLPFPKKWAFTVPRCCTSFFWARSAITSVGISLAGAGNFHSWTNAHLGFLFIKKQGPKYCVSTFLWQCTLSITLPLEQSDCLNSNRSTEMIKLVPTCRRCTEVLTFIFGY